MHLLQLQSVLHEERKKTEHLQSERDALNTLLKASEQKVVSLEADVQAEEEAAEVLVQRNERLVESCDKVSE